MVSGTRMEEVPVAAHRLPLKVYLEDTDAQGIVFHASYVRFFERGRSEYLEALGSRIGDLDRAGLHMAVHELRLKYRTPARLGDRLEVVSTARLASAYRVSFAQRIERAGTPGAVCEATVEVVCIDDGGRLLRLPDEVVALLG